MQGHHFYGFIPCRYFVRLVQRNDPPFFYPEKIHGIEQPLLFPLSVLVVQLPACLDKQAGLIFAVHHEIAFRTVFVVIIKLVGKAPQLPTYQIFELLPQIFCKRRIDGRMQTIVDEIHLAGIHHLCLIRIGEFREQINQISQFKKRQIFQHRRRAFNPCRLLQLVGRYQISHIGHHQHKKTFQRFVVTDVVPYNNVPIENIVYQFLQNLLVTGSHKLWESSRFLIFQ